MVYEEGVETVVVELSKSLEGTGVVGFERGGACGGGGCGGHMWGELRRRRGCREEKITDVLRMGGWNDGIPGGGGGGRESGEGERDSVG